MATDDQIDSGDDGDIVDVLPDDLDATYVGPYLFPNNSRRRIPAVLYMVIGAISIALALGVDSPLVNSGMLIAGIGLVVFGLYGLVAGYDTAIEETEALSTAVATVGFPVGYASAQMSWQGWLSRPSWRILVYSYEAQPLKRGLVLVDGVDGRVLEHFVEDNPEDWSDLSSGPGAVAG